MFIPNQIFSKKPQQTIYLASIIGKFSGTIDINKHKLTDEIPKSSRKKAVS